MKLITKIKKLFKKEEPKEDVMVLLPTSDTITSYIKEVEWDDLNHKLVINHSVHLPYTLSETTESAEYFNEKIIESAKIDFIPEMKIAAQTIGLDLVQVKSPTEMTSGYINFEKEEIEYADTSGFLKRNDPDLYYKNLYENAEKTLYQMKKVQRANEKVVEKILSYKIPKHASK